MKKMIDLINVQYIDCMIYYTEHYVINSFPFRTTALFCYDLTLELEIYKSVVYTSCHSD